MEAKNTKETTIDTDEIERFSRISDEWWNEKGKFAPLHSMNPTRINFIKEQVLKNFTDSFNGLTLLDIGCGGGLIAEPMARLGAKVTGIDASEKNIKVASLHAKKMGLTIDYRCTSAEALAQTNDRFDVVLALEIVEHVADLELFLKSAVNLLKPNGIIIISTLNRTAKSYALAIIGAEYVMRLLPVGTHSWNKFLKPREICNILEQNNMLVSELTGMTMNPITWKWKLDAKDLAVNYIVVAKNTI